jgi:hypothetical protein
VAHGAGGVDEGLGKAHRAVAIVLQQVQRHPLRRLRPDAGQAAQRGRELLSDTARPAG